MATLLTIETEAGPIAALVCSRLANGRVEDLRVFHEAKGGPAPVPLKFPSVTT